MLMLSLLALAADITGGQPAPADRWPQHAVVLVDGQVACSGVLITDRDVLTAAHCPAGARHVLLDASDPDAPGVRANVAARSAHSAGLNLYDIAVLHLDAPVPVPPSPVLGACQATDLRVGATGWIIGLGATDLDGTTPAETLHQARVDVREVPCGPDRGCHPEQTEFIAGGEGVDTCLGDSGSPFLLERDDDAPAVAGILSRAAQPSDRPCGDGGIYARVEQVTPWIRATVHGELPIGPCDVPPQIGARPRSLRRGQHALLSIARDGPSVPLDVQILSSGALRATQGVPGGRLQIQVPDHAPLGPTQVHVAAWPVGQPALRSETRIAITVLPAAESGGCSSAPGALSALWLAVLGLFRRRRPYVGAHSSSLPSSKR